MSEKEKHLKNMISWISFFSLLIALLLMLNFFYNVYLNIFYVILILFLEYLTKVGKPLNNYIYKHIKK